MLNSFNRGILFMRMVGVLIELESSQKHIALALFLCAALSVREATRMIIYWWWIVGRYEQTRMVCQQLNSVFSLQYLLVVVTAIKNSVFLPVIVSSENMTRTLEPFMFFSLTLKESCEINRITVQKHMVLETYPLIFRRNRRRSFR